MTKMERVADLFSDSDALLRTEVKHMLDNHGHTLKRVFDVIYSGSIELLMSTDPNDADTREKAYQTAKQSEVIYNTIKALSHPATDDSPDDQYQG